MIVTVTPNPALDVTYELAVPLQPGAVHRVQAFRSRPGGKGVNVARVLSALGEQVLATGLCGGPGGAALRSELDDCGVRHDFVDALPDVRRTVVAFDSDGSATSFWEPGHQPDVPATAGDLLVAAVQRHLSATTVLIVSGSLPPGLGGELPARLGRIARDAGVPTIADVSGDALRIAVDSGDMVVMPNADELATIAGRKFDDVAEAVDFARAVQHRHRLPALVATLGGDGMVVAHRDGVVHARPPEKVAGNPTGAGDAACAGLARHLAVGFDSVDWRSAAADAVALSAAAVLRPVAGEVDIDAYHDMRQKVAVEEL